jgi:hypothetical protein
VRPLRPSTVFPVSPVSPVFPAPRTPRLGVVWTVVGVDRRNYHRDQPGLVLELLAALERRYPYPAARGLRPGVVRVWADFGDPSGPLRAPFCGGCGQPLVPAPAPGRAARLWACLRRRPRSVWTHPDGSALCRPTPGMSPVVDAHGYDHARPAL